MTNADEGQRRLPDHPRWSVAIFAARESVDIVEEVLRSLTSACAGVDTLIDVLVNGNPDLANGLGKLLRSGTIVFEKTQRVRVWSIGLADKAQTWNTYVHRLHAMADLTFFIDGYTSPEASALQALAEALSEHGEALAATGVPSLGRTAAKQTRTMLAEGGLQGGLFALSREAMQKIRTHGFHLPMGLYRVDSLLGAVISFNFDPEKNSWDASRIVVTTGATYRYRALRWWRIADLMSHLKRKQRQAQGALENLAIKDHLAHRRKPPEMLPETARELVLSWWHGEHGPSWSQVLTHPGWLVALKRLGKQAARPSASQEALVVFDSVVPGAKTPPTPRREISGHISPTTADRHEGCVYVVILNWNGWRDTVKCLGSLFQSRHSRFVAVVCDNGSADGSLEEIVSWADAYAKATPDRGFFHRILRAGEILTESPGEHRLTEDLILIDNAANLGFAGGCNVGIRYALSQPDCTHVWLLNNDTIVPPDSLDALLTAFAARPKLGLCGSQVRFLDRPEIVQTFGGLLNSWFCTTHSLSCGKSASDIDGEPPRIDFVPGASMMASRAFLETIGLMSEDYFLYFEEIDWAERAKGKFAIGVCLNSVVYHAGGASIGTPGEEGNRGLRSEYYLLRGRLMFARRFYPRRLWLVYLGLLGSVVTRLRRQQWLRARTAWCVLRGRLPEGLFKQ